MRKQHHVCARKKLDAGLRKVLAIVQPPAAGVKKSVMRWDDLAYFFEYTIRPSLRTVFVFSIS